MFLSGEVSQTSQVASSNNELREVSRGHNTCKTGKDRTLLSEHDCPPHGVKCRNMPIHRMVGRNPRNMWKRTYPRQGQP